MFIKKSTYERQLNDIINSNAENLDKLKKRLRDEFNKELAFIKHEMYMLHQYQPTSLITIHDDIYFLINSDDNNIKRIKVISLDKGWSIYEDTSFPMQYEDTQAGKLLSFYINYNPGMVSLVLPRQLKFIIDEDIKKTYKIN